MIVVTGATGQLGRAIVEQLARLVPPNQVGASCRDPYQASALAALGVRVRRGDFEDEASLRHAFEGATQVLLVSSNARATGGDALAQHRTAIDAVRSVGAKRIVYTSHMAAGAASAFPPMLDHAATELMLRDSGLAWTSLRNGFYASSGIALLGDALQTGLVEAPSDGKVSWTAHADLAEIAAIVLANEGRFEGPTPPLTASAALDLSDLAAIASELFGKAVRREMITDEALEARLTARGAGRAASIVLGLYRASRNGEFSAVDPTLAQCLGRAPTSMRDVLAHAAARTPLLRIANE